MLAAEPANDVADPWPEIRRKVSLAQRSPRLKLLKSPVRAWATGVAAALVVGLSVGVTVFANQVQTANAATTAEAVYQLQTEVASSGPGVPCGEPMQPPKAAGVNTIAFGGGAEASGPGSVSISDANQLSDKLAQALGVSGDRVREAMRQAVSAELPSGPPPDPLAGIARELGVSTEQVCNAFATATPAASGPVVSISGSDSKRLTTGGPHMSAVLNINGTPINLDSETADQLSGPAHKLGVSPERLLAAIRAAVPAPPPLPATPPNTDDIINRFAKNLGMSPDKVRAAITQVEGPNRFFFFVPLPDFGH